MSERIQRITPFLWFDHGAEAAANLYVSVFDDARITRVVRYGKVAARASGQPEGSVMTVSFELDGQGFAAINGGPVFHLTPAVSFVVNCDDQAEIDHFWHALAAGGEPAAQQCGWLKDRFGVSWQIVPAGLAAWLDDPDHARGARVMQALLTMKKIEIEPLLQAAAG
jgi:predicted 3-demethylubiquinone-9 3-methyltransferase (glyoxalase superfamily)